MRGFADFEVNFQAFPMRLSRAARQQMRIALGVHPVPDRDFHRAAGLALLQLARHLLRDLAQVHRPALERPARHAGRA